MSEKLHCENIKKDLKYLNKIMDMQKEREPTPDVKRFQTQVMYKKELCKIEKEIK